MTTTTTTNLRDFVTRRRAIVRAQPHTFAEKLLTLAAGEQFGGYILAGGLWVARLKGGFVLRRQVKTLGVRT